MYDADDDSDLELGVALSLSEQCVSESEKPVLKVVRKKLLPPVSVSERSKKLLRNVYRSDKKNRAKIEDIIDKAFQTLQVIGESQDTEGGLIRVSALSVALRRLGYGIDEEELQDMLRCYIEGIPPSQISEYTVYTRETVNNRNVEALWQPKGGSHLSTIEYIDKDTFRQIFLDCNLRIETNGLIY